MKIDRFAAYRANLRIFTLIDSMPDQVGGIKSSKLNLESIKLHLKRSMTANYTMRSNTAFLGF